MRYFITLLTIILSFNSFAGLSLNNITGKSLSVNSPFEVNGKLVYVDQNNFMWFNNGTALSASKPQINNNFIQASSLIKVDNAVFFINTYDNDSLWKTDGEIFTKLMDKPFSSLSKEGGNIVSARLRNSTTEFITIDENGINTYNIGENSTDNGFALPEGSLQVCAFNTQSLLYKAKINGTSLQAFYLLNNGVSSRVEFTDLPGNYPAPNLVLKYGDSCIYRSYSNSERKSLHFKVSANGSVSMIENPDEYSFFDNFIEFNNQLIVFKKQTYGVTRLSIFTLADGSLTPELLKTLELDVHVNRVWATENNLYINNVLDYCSGFKKCTPAPPVIYGLYGFDKSLDLVSEVVDNKFSFFSFYDIGNNDYVLFRNGIDELTVLENGEPKLSVKDTNVEIINLIGGSNNTIFVYGKDLKSNKTSLYKLANNAVVSRQLTGLWVSDQWQAQGMSIHTGIRPDESQYLFTSFYIYRNGQPFWLAGTSELDVGTDAITVNLAEYKGMSFLPNDEGLPTKKINFGQMTITPTGCNQIEVVIDIINDETVNLSMDRIIDITNADVCSD